MGREGEGRGGERGGDVEGPGKWSAPGPALALGGPASQCDSYRSSVKLAVTSVQYIDHSL